MTNSTSPTPHSDEHFTGHYVVLVLFLCLASAGIVRWLQSFRAIKRFIPIPFTGLLLCVGMLFGVWHASGNDGILDAGFTSIDTLHPDIILFVFVPALVFESAFSINTHVFLKMLPQALTLAFVGVAMQMGLVALVAYYLFDYSWSWPTAFLLGSILSATDPVAVVALLRELGASVQLSTLIEGESLLNDGSAFVAFLVVLDFVTGENLRSGGEIVVMLLRLTGGAFALGLAFGIVGSLFVAIVFMDSILETIITIVLPYLAFFVAEATGLHFSGVLTVVTVGVVFSSFGRKKFSSRAIEEHVEVVWEMIGWIANSLIFVFSGIIITGRLFYAAHIQGRDWGNLVMIFVFLQIFRFLMMFTLRPLINRMGGYPVSVREGIVASWGGLRGAIGLALALIVDLNAQVDDTISTRVLFLVSGVVVLTLLINATTMTPLLAALKMNEMTPARLSLLDHVKEEVQHIHADLITETRRNTFYDGADWAEVARQTSLHSFEFARKEKERKRGNRTSLSAWALCVCCHKPTATLPATDDPQSANPGDASELRRRRAGFLASSRTHQSNMQVCGCSQADIRNELRKAFLLALRKRYAAYHGDGTVSFRAFSHLVAAVDIALDRDPSDPLCDFSKDDHLGRLFRQPQPSWARVLRRIPGLRWWAELVTFENLVLAFEIANSFIAAHTELRYQVIESLIERHGDSLTTRAAHEVRDEVDGSLKDAREALQVTLSFEDGLGSLVQTRHASWKVLNELAESVKRFGEEGVLEAKETDELLAVVRHKQYGIYVHESFLPTTSFHHQVDSLASVLSHVPFIRAFIDSLHIEAPPGVDHNRAILAALEARLGGSLADRTVYLDKSTAEKGVLDRDGELYIIIHGRLERTFFAKKHGGSKRCIGPSEGVTDQGTLRDHPSTSAERQFHRDRSTGELIPLSTLHHNQHRRDTTVPSSVRSSMSHDFDDDPVAYADAHSPADDISLTPSAKLEHTFFGGPGALINLTSFLTKNRLVEKNVVSTPVRALRLNRSDLKTLRRTCFEVEVELWRAVGRLVLAFELTTDLMRAFGRSFDDVARMLHTAELHKGYEYADIDAPLSIPHWGLLLRGRIRLRGSSVPQDAPFLIHPGLTVYPASAHVTAELGCAVKNVILLFKEPPGRRKSRPTGAFEHSSAAFAPGTPRLINARVPVTLTRSESFDNGTGSYLDETVNQSLV